MIAISLMGLVILLLPLAYLIALAVASVRSNSRVRLRAKPSTRFMVVIPAHNEELVIERTISHLLNSNYPNELFEIHVIADHCTDQTAERAKQTGAIVHIRDGDERSGKGEALRWYFHRMLSDEGIDGVIIFDADTVVDPWFLGVMDAKIAGGAQAIQGQHIIANPDAGWLPALTWAMFVIDNRFQNLGRNNLCLSSKNMGDSICFRVDLLRRFGWGQGLTDDYELRQKLLLEGIKIEYEPCAIGFGEAPTELRKATQQRSRWLAGSASAGQANRSRLLKEGVRNRNIAMIDGALQAWLPSYSTLSVIVLGLLMLHLAVYYAFDMDLPIGLLAGWLAMLGLLLIYPFVGLALDRAERKAYVAILTGPIFIAWRTWLAIKSRLQGGPAEWVRTPHGET